MKSEKSDNQISYRSVRSLIYKARQTRKVVSCARAIAEGLSKAYRAVVKIAAIKDKRSLLSSYKKRTGFMICGNG